MPAKPGKKPKTLKIPRSRTGKTARRKNRGQHRFLLPAGLALLVLLTFLTTCYFIFLRPWTPVDTSPGSRKAERPVLLEKQAKKKAMPRAAKQPALEEPASGQQVIYPDTVGRPDTAARPPADKKMPRIAIVIDDMGYHKDIGDKLLDMELNLTFSFLPFAPHSSSQMEKARLRQRDILLHLPLETTDPSWDPGPGTLSAAMDREQMRQAFNKDLATVPMAIGINNHMGSRFTQDRQAMGALLELVRGKGLFFLDSVTTPQSVGAGMAVAMGVKTARRHVFLDNEQDREKIFGQLATLVKMAKEHGWAVGIGHPHQPTLEALGSFRELYDKRVVIVGVHEMIY